jgi:lipopolysaccharide biosynthesis regulator YciM
MGKIDIKKGEKVEAIKNLEKAEELNKENIQVKILLYELYYKTEGNKEKEKAKKEEILNSKMTEEEKEEFKKLVESFENKKTSLIRQVMLNWLWLVVMTVSNKCL